MAVVNAHVLYKETHDEDVPLLNFRQEVAKGLLMLGKPTHSFGPGAPKRRKVAYSIPATVRQNNLGVRWPKFVSQKGRCEVCSKNGVESRPYSVCSPCGVHLCCNASKSSILDCLPL